MQKESFTTMTMRRIRLKFHAKRALPGNWLRSMFLVFFGILATSFCLSYLVQFVDLNVLLSENQTYEALLNTLIPQPITRNAFLLICISLLLYWLVLSPLTIGITRFFTGVARLQKPKLPIALSVFCDFGLILRSMGLILWISILKVLWGLVFFALPYLTLYAAQILSSALLLELSAFFSLAVTVLYSIKMLAYSPAILLFAEAPSIGVFGAVRQSVAITRGRLTEYLIFELSFLPLRFLAFFTGMFGSLFFEPYYRTTAVVFIDSLRKRFDPNWNCPASASEDSVPESK